MHFGITTFSIFTNIARRVMVKEFGTGIANAPKKEMFFPYRLTFRAPADRRIFGSRSYRIPIFVPVRATWEEILFCGIARHGYGRLKVLRACQ
jgi:hypothetical protein